MKWQENPETTPRFHSDVPWHLQHLWISCALADATDAMFGDVGYQGRRVTSRDSRMTRAARAARIVWSNWSNLQNCQKVRLFVEECVEHLETDDIESLGHPDERKNSRNSFGPYLCAALESLFKVRPWCLRGCPAAKLGFPCSPT